MSGLFSVKVLVQILSNESKGQEGWSAIHHEIESMSALERNGEIKEVLHEILASF